MKTVIVLHHVHIHGCDNEDVKLIGVYSTREKALEAVGRLRLQPGFRDAPKINEDATESGFTLNTYNVDEDNWAEGYSTYTYNK
jgi:homoserine kinase type II